MSEIITPIGNHKVVIKDVVTGFDEQAISGALASGISYEFEQQPDGTTKQRPVINSLSITASNNKAIEVMVTSVDGNSNDVLSAVLNMDRRDTHFVLGEVNKVTEDSNLDEEKKSDSPSSPSSSPVTEPVM